MSSHEGNKTKIDGEQVEHLRRILVREQKREVSYEEAFEVARLLLSFYDNLADNNIGAGRPQAAEAV